MGWTSPTHLAHTSRYPYVVHAEANALLNKNAASVAGAVSRGWSHLGMLVLHTRLSHEAL